ncbi:hypothetical protein OIU76_011552 [Salix suchowensis]|nr:hypothetical protein OIU76_011552 [Salix suchowensis]KAJ6356669.1 hypothetical protein OIU78_004717 [Salix suchowensis]
MALSLVTISLIAVTTSPFFPVNVNMSLRPFDSYTCSFRSSR